MEPFRVTCETCRARLKVRDSSAIGEIHACPKCGSMVHIVPPADWQSEGAASTAAAAAASTPVPDFSHVPPPPDNVADMFEAAASAIQHVELVTNAPPVSLSADAAPLPAAPPSVIPSTFVLGSLAASAVIIVGGLAIAFWWGDDDEKEQEPARVAAAAVLGTPAEAITTSQAVKRPSDSAPDLPSETHVAAKPIPEEPQAAAPEDEPALPALPELPNDRPETSSTTSQSVVADVSPTEAATALHEANRSAGDRVPILKFDPLDFDPSNLSLAGSSVGQRSERPEITSETTTTSVRGDEPSEHATDPLDSADEGGDDIAVIAPTANVRLGPMPRNQPAPDVAKQLAFQLESIHSADTPLHRFVETLSNISGVPITLDPIALELAGVSPYAEVTVQQTNVMLEKVLQSTLQKQRLEFVAVDGQVIVALADATKRSSRQFEFKDLIQQIESDAAELADLIQTFVAPQSWKAASGVGRMEVAGTRLRIEQTKAVHHELLVFCERLRLARGLPLQSRYPKELLSIDSPYTLLETKLDKPATFTHLPWARLADVVRHWQDASGMTILVDWQHLADFELTPATPIACSAVDRPWCEALDEILDTLGLAWWTVDGKTIQITTIDALNDVRRVEFHAVPKTLRDQFANDETLIESLRAEVRKHVNEFASSADELQMRLDAPSGRLIVRGTPPVHQYLSQRFRANTNYLAAEK